jgi:hypothetical protein
VQNGDVPSGSYLLVESLDRLTRASILEAQGLFTLFINAGITLVTLGDRREYSRESITANPMDLIVSIVLMMRGHEESATKARRVADAYERKRKAATAGTENGRPFTRRLPAWLRYNETERKYEVVPERAAVIRGIFEKAGDGWGKSRITNWLNERGEPTWGGPGKVRKAECWQKSYVHKLLRNSAVAGTFTPHLRETDKAGKRRRKPLDPVAGYFPAVVERELFERVTSRARAPAARGRNANNEPVSIFAGVLRCVHCDGVITRMSKGKGQYTYLICSRANRKGLRGCEYLPVHYSAVEEALRVNIGAIIKHAPRGLETGETDNEIAALDAAVSDLGDQAREFADAAVREKSAAVWQRLRDKEQEFERAQEKLRALRARRDALAKPYVRRRLAALKRALRSNPVNVREANNALKEAVAKIVLDPGKGRLTIHWHHARESPSGGVPFFSRHAARVFTDVPTDAMAGEAQSK